MMTENEYQEECQRIGRNLAYWRQLRLSALRQSDHGIEGSYQRWQTAYFRSLDWENTLTLLEAEHDELRHE